MDVDPSRVRFGHDGAGARALRGHRAVGVLLAGQVEFEGGAGDVGRRRHAVRQRLALRRGQHDHWNTPRPSASIKEVAPRYSTSQKRSHTTFSGITQ